MAASSSSVVWFLRQASYDVCLPTRLPLSSAVFPVRVQQLLHWPAGAPVPDGYSFEVSNSTAGPMLALGVAQPCPEAGFHFDRACSTQILPHVLVSYDGGYSWSCLSDSVLPVARLHAGYAVYSASESGTAAASRSACELVCILGGQAGSESYPGGQPYGALLSDVHCSRDGRTWQQGPSLPMGLVGPAAFATRDTITVVGGLRSNGPYGALEARIDPASCTLSGPWQPVQEPAKPEYMELLENSTLQWPMSYPALDVDDCSAWCSRYIGTSAVSFLSLGEYGGGEDPRGYTLSLYRNANPRSALMYTTSEDNWELLTLGLPTALTGSGAPQRIFRLRGPLAGPFATMSDIDAEGGGLQRRIMVASAAGQLSYSANDGDSWQVFRASAGGSNSSDAETVVPGAFLITVGQDVSHNSTPTFLAFNPRTNRSFIGYGRQCVLSCSQLGLSDHWLSSPCIDTPWSFPGCLPCSACPTNATLVTPCSTLADTVCKPMTPIPGPPPPGLLPPRAGSPWVEPLLYTSLLALWLLFVWASGGGRVLAARGMGEQKGGTTKKAIAPWWSNFAQHPSAATPLFVGLVASLAYRLIDLSLVLAAIQLADIGPGARQALAASGVIGFVASSACAALAAVRISAGRKSWLKSRGAWVRGMRALGQAPDPPMRREEDRLTVEEDKRVQLLQSASTAFTLHPLSCLWLDVHLGRAVTMAQATSRALALASMGQSDGGDSTAGSAGQWGSSDSLRTAPLSPAWAVSQVLCSDAVHVFTCMIGAGATLGQGGGWAGAYAGLGVLPLCCALLAAWAFIPVYSAQAKRSLPRTASATTVASSTYNPISQQTEALHAHLERARLPSTGMSTGLNPVLGSSSGAPSRVVQHAAAGQGVLEGAGSMTSDPGPTSYTPHLPLPLLYTAGTLSYAPYPAGVAVPPTEVDAQSSIAGHSSQLSQHIITATGARYMGPYNHYTLEGLDERETVEGTRESTDQDAGLLQRALAAHAARAAVPPPAQAAAAPEPAQVVPAHTDEWQQLTGVLQRGSTTTGRVESPRAVLAGAAMDDGASALAPGPSLWGGSEAPPLLGDAPVSVGLDR